MGGDGGRTAVVVDVECYLCGTVGGEELIEVECVGGGDGDVLRVVEEVDGLIATGCPAVAEVVVIHSGYESLRDVGLEVEHGGGDIVGNGACSNHGVDFFSGVLFA